MMRVLHVYKNYFPTVGGIENHVRLLCHELQKLDVEPAVLVANTSRRTQVDQVGGVRVTRAGRIGFAASTPLSLSLFRQMQIQRPDLVHLHFPYPIGELAYLLCGHHARLVITYHADIVKQKKLLLVYGPFMRAILRRADRILISNPRLLETSPHLTPVADKCVTIPFGLDLSQFEITAQVRARAAEIRQQAGKPIVLFVGLLRYYKGLDYLLRAMPTVDAHLRLVGQGPMEGELRQLTTELGLGDRVRFCGQVDDQELLASYHAAEIFVLPSSHRSEAFGLVQLEAMACGLPVICTELGTGTTYVNRHGETGLVVPPRDPAALAETLNVLLRDAELRQRLGQGGLARVRRDFNARRMADEVLSIYQEMSRDRRAP
ncbi:MAG: glycosyltransferase [Chloroflexota bacterium]|nr:MAG: glycosyltransferase [Chloroflexota bacterium]